MLGHHIRDAGERASLQHIGVGVAQPDIHLWGAQHAQNRFGHLLEQRLRRDIGTDLHAECQQVAERQVTGKIDRRCFGAGPRTVVFHSGLNRR